ncbi:hypothetical protein EUGRSUZ_I01152 [Eucalyptus grandis]|uniref:Uncharacterized protein n=2 Tax=Eucalyptus grandis TaxID=71139 RepID=A0ACC3JDT7_EUCGR|nr:hypothetical protein EUGRSUZ_I01152 [Eucalyptus grandis]
MQIDHFYRMKEIIQFYQKKKEEIIQYFLFHARDVPTYKKGITGQTCSRKEHIMKQGKVHPSGRLKLGN